MYLLPGESVERERNNRIAKDIGFYSSIECWHKEVLDLTWIDILFQNHFCGCQVRIEM
jgi:hypothetical protein